MEIRLPKKRNQDHYQEHEQEVRTNGFILGHNLVHILVFAFILTSCGKNYSPEQ